MTLQWERGSGLTLSDQLQPGEDQLWPGQQPAGPDSRTDTADICTYQHRHAFSPLLPPRPPQSHWWPAWQTSCSHWSHSCHPAHVLSSLQWLCRPSGGALQDSAGLCRTLGGTADCLVQHGCTVRYLMVMVMTDLPCDTPALSWDSRPAWLPQPFNL